MKLKNLANQSSKTIDKLAKKHSRKLVNLLPTIQNYIKANRLHDGLLSPATITEQTIRDLLVRAGLPLWGQVDKELEAMGLNAVANLEKQGITSTLLSQGASQKGILGAMQTVDPKDAFWRVRKDVKTQLSRISDDMMLALKGQLEVMQVAPVSMSQVTASLSARFNVAQRQVQTVVRTGLSAIQREVNLDVGKKLKSIGVEVYYVYQGASDGATRPFCSALVGKAFTLRQIGKMANGQGLSVLKYGGGYNCRHGWFAMSKAVIMASGIPFGTKSDIEGSVPKKEAKK